MNFRDHLGREVILDGCPKRIVSLVPSQTELLFDLGLNDEVVGITKFCVHPEEWYRSKERIGGTKQLHLDKIRALNPDLIIANKEENNKEDIGVLSAEFPVWVSDIKNLDDALHLVTDIGELICKSVEAEELRGKISDQFLTFEKEVAGRLRKKAVYLIWSNPDMVAGNDTFIHEMLKKCGFENVIREKRYPELGTCKFDEPEFILLSSEPFPFGQKHIEAYQKKFANSRVLIVDGEMFSWYGSRLLKVPAYFRELLQKC